MIGHVRPSATTRGVRGGGRALTISAFAVALTLGACKESTVEPTENPLAGLNGATATDSSGNAPPPAPAPGPGSFRGTVIGPSAPGAGNDSLNTAPRVSGAIVAAYPVASMNGATPVPGALQAADTTGADGLFQLPEMPAGSYVVTITPPTGSIYGGVWVTAQAHPTSNTFPWWVVLWRR